MARVELNIDINRTEGDLELKLALEDNVVVDAWTVGTLYRGFEQIMIGRSPRDAMVMTPRVCGICGTAHLYCSVLALEQAWNLAVPAQATRIRNLCLTAEGLQSDIRQTFLYFTPDLCHPHYRDQPWFEQAVAAFEPFKGTVHRQTLALTRKIVGIVAIFGGQWPHSSYMLPGGVVAPAEPKRLLATRAILDEAQQWVEQHLLGMSLDAWLAIETADDYFAALESGPHRDSALGLMTRVCRALDLHRQGQGTPHMLSFGGHCDPAQWGPGNESRIWPDGVLDADTGTIKALDKARISEHVRHSWFRPYPGGDASRHPFEGETVPDYQPASDRYTWAKAPRYGDKVMQTGPLAELIIAGDKLLADLNRREGSGAWLRQFARVRRVAYELVQARATVDEMARHLQEPHFVQPPAGSEVDGQGYGLVMAARGALGHWVRIVDGVIDKYQIITPTAWNASPRDSAGRRGHWEQSLIGLRVRDLDDPIEIGHIIRSHDPCLVCTVHMVDTGKRLTFNA
jgi:hydrogenase large subunit